MWHSMTEQRLPVLILSCAFLSVTKCILKCISVVPYFHNLRGAKKTCTNRMSEVIKWIETDRKWTYNLLWLHILNAITCQCYKLLVIVMKMTQQVRDLQCIHADKLCGWLFNILNETWTASVTRRLWTGILAEDIHKSSN